jgi:hypothetical protein
VNNRLIHVGDPEYRSVMIMWRIGMGVGVLLIGLLALVCFRFGFNTERYIRLCEKFGYEYQ